VHCDSGKRNHVSRRESLSRTIHDRDQISSMSSSDTIDNLSSPLPKPSVNTTHAVKDMLAVGKLENTSFRKQFTSVTFLVPSSINTARHIFKLTTDGWRCTGTPRYFNDK
jgi:hypothetical protein